MAFVPLAEVAAVTSTTTADVKTIAVPNSVSYMILSVAGNTGHVRFDGGVVSPTTSLTLFGGTITRLPIKCTTLSFVSDAAANSTLSVAFFSQ